MIYEIANTASSDEQNTVPERFFDKNYADLEVLFSVLGHEADWPQDLAGAVAYTQAEWVPGDHWKPKNQEPFSDQQVVEAKRLFKHMGLLGEVLPPAGEYDQIIILGAMMRANNARTEFLAKLLSEKRVSIKAGGQLLFWGGPRVREKLEDLPTEDLFKRLADPSHSAHDNPWLQQQLALSLNGGSAGRQAFHTEAQEGRGVMLDYLGDMKLKRAYLDLYEIRDNMPSWRYGREISRYEFEIAHSGIQAILMNARTVDRPIGEPRHTTEQCAAEWLETVPPALNSRVLFVTSNPYTPRTTLNVSNLATAHGRADLEITGCGSSAYIEAKPQLFMGEIGRLLYEDLQATR